MRRLSRLLQRAHCRSMQRFAAAQANGELPGAANLFGKRAASGVGSSGERPKANAAAPQQRCQHDQIRER